ncbi:MAG: glycosyltransferase [Acidobacteriaceae bacterium]|nr:glycosyltransferase [Acidobacteriaceae bacterium]
MNPWPRVAFLPDTFHEVNGVAHTSRQLQAFAKRHAVPFLSVHCGPATEKTQDGVVTVLELKRGPASFALDAHLDCDPFLLRYKKMVVDEIKHFGAQLIHITGPGDLGVLGSAIAWQLKLPLVISWHTSLHEYAGRRLEQTLRCLGHHTSRRAGATAEQASMGVLRWFYRRASLVLAPNDELVEMLSRLTHKPVFLMRRGVNTELFSPARRNLTDSTFRIGYVGRLTTEKNVRFLAELGTALTSLGRTNFEFLIVGQGSESEWLRQHIPNAVFTGVLRGERLAAAFANMDVFVFPSKTDTFGNVILEAFAAGLPAVVTSAGGPKFLVEDGVTGFIAASEWEFIRAVNNLMCDAPRHTAMCLAARQYACAQSWDAVFEKVFEAYSTCLNGSSPNAGKEHALLSSRVHERGGS